MSTQVIPDSGMIKDLFSKEQEILPSHYVKIRESAYNQFSETGLPGRKHEDYKYFPVHRNYPEKFEVISELPAGNTNTYLSRKINDPDGVHIFFINGILDRKLSTLSGENSPLQIKSLKELDPVDFEQYFGPSFQRNNINGDPFITLNNALINEGLLLRLKKENTSKPVYCYHFSTGLQRHHMVNSRLTVLLEEDSKLDLSEFYYSSPGEGGFENHLTEIFAERGSKMNYHKIQEKSANEVHLNHTNIYQKESSNINTYTFALKGQLLRNNLNFILNEENCESHLYGLYYLREKDLIDNHTTVDHRKPNCFSNENYKGIMDDQGKAVFNGKIYVRPNAQKTNAFQSNKNIVLTDSATINTKPQLEIWADDVKCSHGATTGQIDEEQLFYLRSRGLDLKSARALLLHAFAFEIVDKVELEPVRQYLTGVLNKQLGYQIIE